MISEENRRLIRRCAHLLMYNYGGLAEVSKCRGILGNINQHNSITPEQSHFLRMWYEENQDQLDWMRF